jgi:HlyD family secretion protein
MNKNKLQNAMVFFGLVIILLIVVIYTNRQSENQDLISQTTRPFITTIINKKIISGNLFPIKEIEIKSPISGILETYYIQIGEVIKKGDKLAKIKMLPDPSQLENTKKNLNTSRITFEWDKVNFERENRLFEKGVISKLDFEQTSKTYMISKEQFESAENQLRLLEEGNIPTSNISNIITATIGGTITDVPLDEGAPVVERNTFREGSTIVVIARLDSFLFKGKVIESDIIALKKGMEITITPNSISNFKVKAIIRKISPKGLVDQGIMKYEVEAVFTIPDSVTIYSGFNATAEIILEKKENILALEEKNISFEHDSAFVNVVEKDNKITHKRIWTGISDGLNIEVNTGIDIETKIKVK